MGFFMLLLWKGKGVKLVSNQIKRKQLICEEFFCLNLDKINYPLMNFKYLSSQSNFLKITFGLVISFGLLSAGYSAKKMLRGEIITYVPSPPRSNGAAVMGLGDRTGSPIGGAGSSCANCHGGGSFSPSISIDVKDAGLNSVTSYIPGNTYTIEYTVLAGSGSPSGYGMQGVALNPSNGAAGNLFSPTTPNTQITSSGGVQYLEHQSMSATGSFQTSWTAPMAGSGAVSIYARGLALNGDGSTSGDDASTSVLFGLTETIPTTISFPGTPFCANELNQSPTQTGETGGAFSAPAGLIIDAGTGVIDISNSTIGTYQIDYAYSMGTTSFSITINPTYIETAVAAICSNETLIFGSQTLNASDVGLNTELFQSIDGCDSIVNLTLTVNTTSLTQESATICDNETLSWASQTLDASNAGLNTVVLSTVNGCDSTLEINLTVLPAYSETTTITICEGETFAFNGQTLDSTNAGLNTSTFQSANGCDSLVSLTLNIETIDAQVTVTSGQIAADQSGGAYQWLDCDNGNIEIVGATSQSFSPLASGNYAVEITIGNCSKTSACAEVTVFTSLHENNLSLISISPNPVKDVLHIENYNELLQVISIEIVDAFGKRALKVASKDETINISKLPAGTYFLTINHDAGQEVVKFIKR